MSMSMVQFLTPAVFAVTIIGIIMNRLDATAVALIGVTVMIWVGTMTEEAAFLLVDWNVMAILVSIWVIAGYFGKTGVPSWLSVQSMKLSGGRPGPLVIVLSMLAGLHLDVRRQRRDHPDDGAGGAAAGARLRHSGDAAGADDRLLAPTSWAPRCCSATCRRRCCTASPAPSSSTSSGSTAAVVVPDPDGDVHPDAGVHVLLRLPPDRQADRARAKSQIEAKIPDPLLRLLTVGMFLLTVLAMAFREILRRQARLHRHDRRRRRWC